MKLMQLNHAINEVMFNDANGVIYAEPIIIARDGIIYAEDSEAIVVSDKQTESVIAGEIEANTDWGTWSKIATREDLYEAVEFLIYHPEFKAQLETRSFDDRWLGQLCQIILVKINPCLLYTSPSPRD